MKPIIQCAVSILTAGILSISCNKHSREAVGSANSLIGRWQLDSLLIGKDTSLAYILTAMAIHEKGGVSFRFTGDSIFTSSQNDIDTTTYKFAGPNLIITKENPEEQIYSYSKVSDTAGLLQTKQTVFFIRRKN